MFWMMKSNVYLDYRELCEKAVSSEKQARFGGQSKKEGWSVRHGQVTTLMRGGRKSYEISNISDLLSGQNP